MRSWTVCEMVRPPDIQSLRPSDLAAGAEPSQPDCDSLLLQEVHPLLDVDRSWRECERSRTDQKDLTGANPYGT